MALVLQMSHFSVKCIASLFLDLGLGEDKGLPTVKSYTRPQIKKKVYVGTL